MSDELADDKRLIDGLTFTAHFQPKEIGELMKKAAERLAAHIDERERLIGRLESLRGIKT